MNRGRKLVDNPVISVIVPVYNSENFLENCIDSILSQTYQNFELILIDDGSTDNSSYICDYYSREDNRIRVIHQINQGQAQARNYAVEKARGSWIHFVDSDDMIHPQMLEILLNAVEMTDAKMSMCGSLEVEEMPVRFQEKESIEYIKLIVTEDTFRDLYEKGGHRYWIVCSKLIHKSIIKSIPLPEGRIYEDNATVIKWINEAGIIADVKENLYFYRINFNGTSKSPFNLKKLDYLWALCEQIHFYKKQGFNSMLRIIFLQYMEAAISYYKKVKYELNNNKCANKIKTKLFKEILLNQKHIEIPKSKKDYMLEVFYPSIMKWYEYVIAGKKVIKQEGKKFFSKSFKSHKERRG